MRWAALASVKMLGLAISILLRMDLQGGSVFLPAASTLIDVCSQDMCDGLRIPFLARFPGAAAVPAARFAVDLIRERLGIDGSSYRAFEDRLVTASTTSSREGPAKVSSDPDASDRATAGDSSDRDDEDEDDDQDSRSGHHHHGSSDTDLGIGGSRTVASGETASEIVSIGEKVLVDGDVSGDVTVIGGGLTITGTVHGEVHVIGGVARISGTVRSDLVAVASRLTLEDTARIGGSCVNVLGRVQRAPGSRIGREFHSIGFVNLGWFATDKGLWKFLLLLTFWVGLVGTAVRFLGVLVVSAVASSNIEGALSTPRPSWILAFLLGLSVHFVAIFVDILLIALCVTIPVAVVLGIALRVVKWMGLASIYLLIGRRIGQSILGRELSYFASILLGFLLLAIVGFLPIVGWLVTSIFSVTGLGLMLLTQFGTKWRKAVQQPSPLPTTGPASAPV